MFYDFKCVYECLSVLICFGYAWFINLVFVDISGDWNLWTCVGVHGRVLTCGNDWRRVHIYT